MWTRYGSFGKLEVSDDLSEPDRNPDDKTFGFCGERSSVTLYKQKLKRNSTALQLVGKKHRCNYGKRRACEQRAQGSAEIEFKTQIQLHWTQREHDYLLIMMMDDLTTFQKEQNQNSIMERLLNKLASTYLPAVSQFNDEMCITESIEKLDGDHFDLPGNLFFGC